MSKVFRKRLKRSLCVFCLKTTQNEPFACCYRCFEEHMRKPCPVTKECHAAHEATWFGGVPAKKGGVCWV